MEKIDCAVIGAGGFGLAVARRLAAQGREVLILEAEAAFGSGTGRRMLYDYCAERGIGHRRCGKLIVATGEDQHMQLEAIAAKARANGVHDLQFLGRDEARALEPALECTAALLSPTTGIIDSHGLMLALLGDA